MDGERKRELLNQSINSKRSPDEPTADQKCCCNRERECSCAIKRELLGPIAETPKRGIKRTRSNTETDKDKARPRGLSATQSDPNLNVFAKRNKTSYHRYSHSGQESSTYHGRPHSQHGAGAFSPVSVDSIMAQNSAFMMGRRPQSLHAFSPYSTESMDSLSSLPYDIHRPLLHRVPNYSSDAIETHFPIPSRDNLPYDVPRPRSIHGHAPFAQKLDGFQQLQDSTPLYADGVSGVHDERRVRSAHTSPGPAPAEKLQRYANRYPHLDIPTYGAHNAHITSSPVGGDEYGHQRYGNLDYVSPTDGAASMSGDHPGMPVADWTPLDLPLNNPGAFTSAQSHASSNYASVDPGLLAQQPGLTDASSTDVSEPEEFAQHQSVASPSVACTSPYVQSTVEARGSLLPYGVSSGDPYADLSQSTMLPGQVENLSVEPYLHHATASPVDHTGYAMPPKTEAEVYQHHGMPVPDPQRLSSFAGGLDGTGDMSQAVAQPTSDPSWAEGGGADNGASYGVGHTTVQPTSDPSWVASHGDPNDMGHVSPHHSANGELSPHLVATSQAHIDPNWAAGMRQAHDGSPVADHSSSRHQSPYAAAMQPTSDPTWAANAAVAAAHDAVGGAPSAGVRSRNHSPHPSVTPMSNPAWASPHVYHPGIADASRGGEMDPGMSAAAMMQQSRQPTPSSSDQGDAQQKLGQQQLGQGDWNPAAAGAMVDRHHQQPRTQFHPTVGGAASPSGAGAYSYDG